jgi:hypothetical protein
MTDLPQGGAPGDPGGLGVPDVDPLDVDQVAAVIGQTLATFGAIGVVDLLARMPGTTRVPDRPGGLFRKREPEAVIVGEHRILMADPLVDEHVVGGITLARDALSFVDVGPVLARHLTRLVTETGTMLEATAVLTAARDTAARFG